LGSGQKGLYVSAYGGLPLFSSGNLIGKLQQSSTTYIAFSEPCDPTHVKILRSHVDNSKHHLQCTRSLEIIGWIEVSEKVEPRYVVDEDCLCFLPFNVPWPVQCQPENFWGTEGQYRSWNRHDLISKPLSY